MLALANHPGFDGAFVGHRRPGVVVGCLLLAGCADARLRSPQLGLPVAYEASTAATVPLPAAALDRWWTLFDDPQLTGLIEAALVNGQTARTALSQIAQARATRAQTLAIYLPQGNLTGEAQQQHTHETFGAVGVATTGGTTTDTTTGTTAGADVGTGLPVGGGTTTGSASTGSSSFLTPSGDLQTYGASFNISYEVDLFGRRLAARRAADADVASARFAFEGARATLARDVATGLFNARGAAAQLADSRETYRITRALARSAEVSARVGLTATSDAARLETDAATAQAEVARLEAVVLADRRALLALVGRGSAPLASLPVSGEAQPPPPAPQVTPAELLRRRPDVREAEARVRSAANTLKLDRLALFPTFSLAPGGQYAKTEGSYSSTTTIWQVGLNASLPVLDRPRLLAAIQGQRAVGEQAVIAYEQTVQNAYRDAETGLIVLAADRTRLDRLEVAVSRARFAYDAKKRGYDLGLVDLTTLLDAERSWRTATLTQAEARTTALVDAATLFQALGGGWPSQPVRLASAGRPAPLPR